MIYLTVNDAPSGVYKSQVIDVIKELNKISSQEILLVSLISLRDFKKNKKRIRKWYPNSEVYPMIPKLKNWKKNTLILKRISNFKNETILARGPMAFYLSNKLNESVSYDGRGAVKAELIEFPDMIPDKSIVESLIDAEKNAVLKAKHRIAVSNQLLSYWKNEYGYIGESHTVIPCTLSNDSVESDSDNQSIYEKFSWNPEDVVLVYSGSISGWQSFELLSKYLSDWISKQKVNVLFLSKENEQISQLEKKFPDNIRRLWLDHAEVSKYLEIGDYGILIRDENITNQVASPVKFAEYLSVGLKVLISDNLGDYTELLKENNLGHLVNNERSLKFVKTKESEKLELKKYSDDHFTKRANRGNFEELLKKMV